MGSLAHRYRDLETEADPITSDDPEVTDVLEDMQLASFDSGYQAGWDDASKAHDRVGQNGSEGIVTSLQDMSFTHQEAYVRLRSEMKPLLMQITTQLFPELLHKALGAQILEQLIQLSDAHAQTAIEIAINPGSLQEVNALLTGKAPVPFALVEDAALKAGQAHMRAGGCEREIDLDAVLAGISQALESFFEQAKAEMTDE